MSLNLRALSRCRRPLIAVGVVLLASAAPAPAAEIRADGGILVYQADSGEENFPMLYPSSRGISITDLRAGGIRVATGLCHAAGDHEVQCATPGALRLALGDGDDRVDWGTDFPSSVVVEILGEAGQDELEANEFRPNRVTLDGGDGNDVLQGFAQSDRLRGGPGDDALHGDGGDDQLEGGDGADRLRGDAPGVAIGHDTLDGGSGHDVVRDWDDPARTGTPPITVSLDGRPGDGRPGEQDNVLGIEEIHSYSSGTFALSDGNDRLHAYSSQDEGPSTVHGLGGDDALIGYNYSETLHGGPGADTLEGGFGHDVLVGGPGPDALYGDSRQAQCGGYGQSCIPPFGNDVIDARDGEADAVDCGVGEDRVVADALDVIAASCETVDRPGSSAPGAAAPTRAGGARPTLRVVRDRLGTALRRGLRLRLTGAGVGRHRVVVRVGRAVVARRTLAVRSRRTAAFTVRFSRSARRKLARRRAVRFAISVGGVRTVVRLRR